MNARADATVVVMPTPGRRLFEGHQLEHNTLGYASLAPRVKCSSSTLEACQLVMKKVETETEAF